MMTLKVWSDGRPLFFTAAVARFEQALYQSKKIVTQAPLLLGRWNRRSAWSKKCASGSFD
jgi:hypothetical protein